MLMVRIQPTLWINELKYTEPKGHIGIHEISRKYGLVQIGLEIVDQRLELTTGMVVRDDIACPLPDMFLRVQVGTGRREVDGVQAVSLFDQAGHFAIMPRGTIQQE